MAKSCSGAPPHFELYLWLGIQGDIMIRHTILLAIFLCHGSHVMAAPSQYVYGLEANAGMLGTWEADPGKEMDADPILSTTLGVVPWFERSLSKGAGVGMEVGFHWIKNNRVEGKRQLIITPMPRIRMSFPLSKKVTFDGFMAVGPHVWWEPDDPEAVFGFGPEPMNGEDPLPYIEAASKTRFGWGLRFGFGGSYTLNKHVQTFVHFGYMFSATHDEDVTIGFQSFPFGFGFRNQF